MSIDEIINKFYNIINLSEKLSFVTIDIKIAAIKELQYMIDSMSDNAKPLIKEPLMNLLELLKNHGKIFDFKKLENGVKIYPKDKIYCFEDDLIITLDDNFNDK